ncbi:MAG: aspartate ammonia-lyase [Candidatus Bipolaricaulota bacterium]
MTRTERDSLGKVEVPDGVYYGSFTARALENFELSGETPPPELVAALGKIKIAAARVNEEFGNLDREKSQAIVSAAEEVVAGEYEEEFPLDLIQAGAGTPIHMNVNEVIANRATELLGGKLGDYLVHPNDHVNMGQSSNNVVPTSFRLVILELKKDLSTEMEKLGEVFEEKSDEFANLVKVGRTHYQDAVPVTLGQEFGAYAHVCRRSVKSIAEAAESLYEVGLGGNAVGTGINTAPGFRKRLVAELSSITGVDLIPAKDPVATTQSMEPFLRFSGSLRDVATELVKVSDDLMFLSSGPKAGVNELELPEVEPGSSIMPGKVNPSIVEAVKMSLLQVLGYDQTVSLASREGHLELNVMTPLIGKNLISAVLLFTRSMKTFREDCVRGIRPNREVIKSNFDKSTAVATALSPYLGYERVADLVKTSLKEERGLRELVLDREWLTENELETVLDPERLTSPGEIDDQLREKVEKRLKKGSSGDGGSN